MDRSTCSQNHAWDSKVLNKMYEDDHLIDFIFIRKLDSRGRQKIKKDCDEVFPQIIIGTGDCIKDVSIKFLSKLKLGEC